MNRRDNPPLFIFGTARSGTSLVSRIVNGHPEIGVPYESLLYPTFYSWRSYYGNLSEKRNKQQLIKDILSFDAIQRWSPVPSYEDIYRNCTGDDFNGVFEGLIRAWLEKQGKTRWGEKTPHHAYYWKELLSGFPDMKVIHIIRDGRDVALSWKKARFGPTHVLPIAYRWVDYLRTVEDMKPYLKKEQFLEIHYEQLLTSPRKIVKGICRFIGVNYSESMLKYYKSRIPYPTDATNFQNLSRPLIKTNTEKWRKEMSEDELRIFESIAGSQLTEKGYRLSTDPKPLSKAEELAIRYLIHPPGRIAAMAKNKRGYIEMSQKIKIYSRLLLTRQGTKNKYEKMYFS